MQLSPLTENSLPLIKNFFQNDPQAFKRMNAYQDSSTLWKLIQDSKNRHCWLAYVNNHPVGFLDLEITGEFGYIAFLINKENRGKGLGKEIVSQAINLPEMDTVSKVEAAVEEDNTASIKALLANGFVNNGIDKDGLVRFTKLKS